MNFLQASDVGAAGQSDPHVLQIAADEGRILVSHDVKTLPRHFGQFIAQQSRPGLILIPQRLRVGAAVEELPLIWLASETDEWVNQVCYLPL